MRYPYRKDNGSGRLITPIFSGGINLRDRDVADNQLTDCINMWFSDGVLKTRPAVSMISKFDVEGVATMLTVHDVWRTVDGVRCRLVSVKGNGRIYFFLVGKGILENLSYIYEGSESDWLVVDGGNVIYCFLSNKKVYSFTDGAGNWNKLSDTDFYQPLVLSDGVLLEGLNMLSPYYRARFSSFDPERSIVDSEGEVVSPMAFKLPLPITEGSTITIKRTKLSGSVVTKDIVMDSGDFNIVNDGEYTIYVGSDGTICYYDGEIGIQAYEKHTKYLRNNIEVTATYDNSEKYEEMMKFTCAVSFGGASEGIAGGTRVFLGGHTENKNLVRWSGLNNPLYFPENNFFLVGDASSRVTAFGKQADMLVIFKEYETYYTKYRQNISVSAEDMTDMNAVDYISSSVYFPLTLINPTLGCDCPDTVQLCRNRLVWTNSDGRVYTLCTANQYSETNIYELGGMIYPKLKKENNLKNAHSADWNGHYLLQTENRIYLFDYNSYGYQYVSSFSKNEDASLRIPWYYFEFPVLGNVRNMAVIGVSDMLGFLSAAGDNVLCESIDPEERADSVLVNGEEKKSFIRSEMQTKEYGLGLTKCLISGVRLDTAGENGYLLVTAIADGRKKFDAISLRKRMRSLPLNLRIVGVERFGVRLQCDGYFEAGQMSFGYKNLGGVK